MNRPILTPNKPSIGKLFRKSVLTLLLVGAWAMVHTAYGQCNISLACNDGVNVSLDENCEVTMLPDMILENMQGVDADYLVEVTDENGDPVDADPLTAGVQLDGNHVGMTFTVSITHIACGLSCWGTIYIEDKLGPEWINCDSSITPIDLECYEDTDPISEGGDVPGPNAVDACGGPVTYQYIDEVSDLGCSDPYVTVITRKWIATDQHGATSEICEQEIRVLKANISGITFPGDRIYECTDFFVKLPSGAPSPVSTGYPLGVECSNIQHHFTDLIFELCGAGLKVVRQWYVIDWCTGQDTTHNQIIKVMDTTAPVVACGEFQALLTTVSTSANDCFARNVEVPNPFDQEDIIVIDCSEVTYTIAYKQGPDDEVCPEVFPEGEFISDDVIDNGDSTYTIPKLEKGCVWIRYTFTDACGNQRECTREIKVVDDIPPVAICEGYTVVSLGEEGWADIYATSIDDHSLDNCWIDSFAIKRLDSYCTGFYKDLEFGRKVNFCCDDVGQGYIKVVMRVYDENGNHSDCIANVTVDDKQAPVISCPARDTITCDIDYTNPANTGGYATAEDNCDVEVTKFDSPVLNACGIGYVRRTWRATDPQGLTDSCTQFIYIENNDTLTEDDIYWPQDEYVEGCGVYDIDPDVLDSKPYVINDGCINVGISYTDEYFYDVAGYCIKVLRHWKVADWCEFNPDDPFYFTHTQKVHLNNSVAPTFGIDQCNNIQVDADDGFCSAFVNLVSFATDDCTPAGSLYYNWEIDLYNDGSVDLHGLGNDASGKYPTGNHLITFWAEDDCGNVSFCKYTFKIKDNLAPQPICLAEVVWVMDEDGTATVWASDFDFKSKDYCTPDDQLIFSFNQYGNQPSLTFDCDDLPNGIAQEIALEMYVIDSDGNYDHCDVILTLQDNGNDACADGSDSMAAISGRVADENNTGMEDFNVTLLDADLVPMQYKATDDQGQFEFDEVQYYLDYNVSPVNNENPLNGVSTLDLLLIQKHILNLKSLDSPYKLIAADVNNSRSISATDLIELRKLVLGIYDSFPKKDSWIFVLNEVEFIADDDPWNYTDKTYIENLILNRNDVDFTAVKTGDVNGSADPNFNAGSVENRNSEFITIKLNEVDLGDGNVDVAFVSTDKLSVNGMQFTFEYDPVAYSFVGVGNQGAFKISDVNIGSQLEASGTITLSWNDIAPHELDEGVTMFALRFEKNGISQLKMDITSGITKAEAYDANLEVLEINTRGDIEDPDDEIWLDQNQPNPFSDVTSVTFGLGSPSDVGFKVYDVNGRILKELKNTYPRGNHTVTIDSQDFDASGVLYYQLETGSTTLVKKMVLIR